MDGVRAPFGAAEAATVDAEYHALARRGLQGLLIASRTLTTAEFEPALDLSSYVHDLDFMGLVGLMDPPRPEPRPA